MEWCLDCHRNPAKYLRPTSQIYNMAWEAPSEERPVWCAAGNARAGVPTAQSVDCVAKEPGENSFGAEGAPVYRKLTSQNELGHFLVDQYKIRPPSELTSCEVCHR